MIDYIDVTPRSEPDPDWVYVDKQGHSHRWDFALNGAATVTSLKYVEDDPGDDEYPPSGHFECRECGEHIQRQERATRFKQYMRVSL